MTLVPVVAVKNTKSAAVNYHNKTSPPIEGEEPSITLERMLGLVRVNPQNVILIISKLFF